MKLFNKTILAIMAVAVSAGFSACSDDDDYIAATNQDGAYFAADAPETVGVLRGAESFDIEVYRTDGSQHTYDLLVTDPKDMFEVPDKVVFDGQNHKVTITVGIKGEMQEETLYPLQIKIIDGSGVGLIDYKFDVKIAKTPTATIYNYGVYEYVLFNEDPHKIPVIAHSTVEEPNVVTWQIGGTAKDENQWLRSGDRDVEGVNFYVEFDDFSDVTDEGLIYCHIPIQGTTVISDNLQIMMSDIPTFFASAGLDGSRYENECYYDTTTGLLTLHIAYFLEGTSSWYGADIYEYLQLDGFPNYSVNVEYGGMYFNRNNEFNIIGNFTAGADVKTIKAILMKTSDPAEALDAISNDEEGVETYDVENSSFTKYYNYDGAGVYILFAVSLDADGEFAKFDYDKFEIPAFGGEDPNKGWTSIGQADFADGWITGAFNLNGVPIDVYDYMFPVEIQMNDEQPGLYRMMEPWGPDFPISSENAYPATRNIEFWVEPDIEYVGFEPQPSGFGTKGWKGEMEIGDSAGDLAVNNPDATHADVVAFLTQKYPEDLSTYEDGIVRVNVPLFGAPGIGDGTFGYHWNNVQPSELYMPDMPESAKKYAKAKRVAAPNLNGLHQTIRAKRDVAKGKIHVLRQLNANDPHSGGLIIRK